jgi:hypothetical protein
LCMPCLDCEGKVLAHARLLHRHHEHAAGGDAVAAAKNLVAIMSKLRFAVMVRAARGVRCTAPARLLCGFCPAELDDILGGEIEP